MANELILIVEDDDNSRKLLRDSLQVTGYETAEANNGELGLELARQRKPALILMDIQLPGISGFDALRSLRGDPDTRTIPVIVNSMARGMTAAVISAARKFPSSRNRTTITSRAPSTRFFEIVCMVRSTSPVRL